MYSSRWVMVRWKLKKGGGRLGNVYNTYLYIYTMYMYIYIYTLQGTNISPQNGILKMIFLFPRWDMLIPWRVYMDVSKNRGKTPKMDGENNGKAY